MFIMDYKYYIGEGPEALAVITAIKEKRQDIDTAREKFKEDFGIDEFVTYDDCYLIKGVTFKGEVPKWAREVDKHQHKPFQFYTGNRSYKKGKEFCARKKELTYSWVDDLLKKCEVSRWLVRGRNLYVTRCGYTKDKVFVGIPFDSNAKDYDEPMPTIPSWMREVKKSEWLAAAGR